MADSDNGNWIPASQRPDGTWRKPRQVKEGYVPVDEEEKYESKGKQWTSNMPTLPPGASEDTQEKTEKMSKNRKKNERKKQQRKEKNEGKIGGNDGVEEVRVKLSDTSLSAKDEELAKANKDKKIKNLKKKLRQIAELQEKGEVNELTKEQKEKLQRKKGLEKELKAIEMT